MYEDAAPAQSGSSLSWHEVWLRAVTRPSDATYTGLLQDPKATPGRGYGWVALSSLIGFIITSLGSLLLNMVLSLGAVSDNPMGALGVMGGSIGGILCGAPVAVVVSLLSLIISVGISNGVAKLLGGTGTFSELVYAVACYAAPIGLLSSLLTAIPLIGPFLVFLPGLYVIVLNVIAVKATHKFGWGKAVVSSVLVFVVLAVVVAVVVIGLLVLLGPAIQKTFEEIVREMSALPF